MRWIFYIISVVFCIAVVLVVFIALFLPNERILSLGLAQLERELGRTILVSGNIKLKLFPVPGLEAETISIENADWEKGVPFIRADALRLELNLGSALRGSIVVDEIRLIRPEVNLKIRADGVGNWPLFKSEAGDREDAAPSASSPNAASALRFLRQVHIEKGKLRFEDLRKGKVFILDALDARAHINEESGRLDIELNAIFNGEEIETKMRFVGGKGGFFTKKQMAAKIELAYGGAELAYEGKIAPRALLAEGDMTARLSDVQGFLAALKGVFPTLPSIAETLVKKLNASGKIVLSSKEIALSDMTVRLDAQTLRASLALNFSPKPRLTGKITAKTFDFTRALKGGNGAKTKARQGWSKEKVNAGVLSKFEAALSLSIDRLKYNDLTVSARDLKVTLDRARLVLEINKAGLYEGTVSGQYVINARRGLSMGGNLRLKEVSVLPLLQALSGRERLAAQASGSLKFLALGDSVDAWAHSLSGEGDFLLNDGSFKGIDLAKMLQNFGGYFSRNTGSRTVFDTLTGSFTIDKGVFSNNDLLLHADFGEIHGEGNIDIGSRRFDYKLTPKSEKGRTILGDVLVPILVTGPWESPKFAPVLSAVLEDSRGSIEKAIRESLGDEISSPEKLLNNLLGGELGDGEVKKSDKNGDQKKGDEEKSNPPSGDDLGKEIENELKKNLGDLLNF